MKLDKAYEKLVKSEEFKSWPKKDKTFLSHCFTMDEEEWQFGFYDKGIKKSTIFFVTKDFVETGPESEIANLGKVEEIDISRVKTSLNEAKKIANEDLLKSGEQPDKTITIMQKIDKVQVWNLTIMTKSFKVGNYKVKVDNGTIISKELNTIFDFKAKD